LKPETRNQKAEGRTVQALGIRHRVAITHEAGAGEKTGETVIQKIFDELPGREVKAEL
jgi:hypothetical protein